MIPLLNKPNVDPVSSEYPYGNIKDDDGTGNGTPVDTEVYADIHQTIERIMFYAKGLGITPNGQPDNAYNGFQIFEAMAKIFGLKKEIDIGDWNMDSTTDITKAHGLDLTKIRKVEAIIYADSGTNERYMITDYVGGNPATIPIAGSIYVDATTVHIVRLTGGPFDNSTFDQTSYNRGKIIITYDP